MGRHSATNPLNETLFLIDGKDAADIGDVSETRHSRRPGSGSQELPIGALH